MNTTTWLISLLSSSLGTSGGILLAQTVPAISEHTNVPLSGLLATAGTVFIIAMWVSKKTTTFEINQEAFFRRLDQLDAKQQAMSGSLAVLASKVEQLEKK